MRNNGNMTTKTEGPTHFAWDFENRLNESYLARRYGRTIPNSILHPTL
jgi:hypothetical protein